ncbi:MAG: hypothetical protein QM820_38310 [Minicystis sp.]
MRLRASVTAAVIAAGLFLSAAAGAQGPPLPARDGAARGPQPAAEPAAKAVDIIDVERFFSAPRALGDAWERAVQAALDGMRALRDAERVATQAPLPVAMRKPAPPWPTIAPVSHEARFARFVVTFQPVTVEPVTQSVVDVRGQRAILLGSVVALPWSVP